MPLVRLAGGASSARAGFVNSVEVRELPAAQEKSSFRTLWAVVAVPAGAAASRRPQDPSPSRRELSTRALGSRFSARTGSRAGRTTLYSSGPEASGFRWPRPDAPRLCLQTAPSGPGSPRGRRAVRQLRRILRIAPSFVLRARCALKTGRAPAAALPRSLPSFSTPNGGDRGCSSQRSG